MDVIGRASLSTEQRRRLRLDVTGAVQGVGFRPFVHGLAAGEGLAGFVRNTPAGASLEIEGSAVAIERFLARLDAELPLPAQIVARTSETIAPLGDAGFAIVDSHVSGRATARVLPDLVTCDACLQEILDPRDRRHLYPFTTCTHCGPRYTIIEALPYDRRRTSMRHFEMCPACAEEYADPASRRFHAETNACPVCGPQLKLLDMDGRTVSTGSDALERVTKTVRGGGIVALKGIGGFHLLADARSEASVVALRQRKSRPAKPFAVMVSSLDAARLVGEIDPIAAEQLLSPAGPIALVRSRQVLAPAVAPENPNIAVMLPTSPLHHILCRDLGFPIIATSGNRGDEPIASTDAEALERLGDVADVILTHDRPIVRPVDDSVIRLIAGVPTTLRHGRGHAPLVINTHVDAPAGQALGGQQKTAIALFRDRQTILSPHIGDLDSVETRTSLERAVTDLTELHAVATEWVACDAHPDYFTTALADRLGPRTVRVPHHAAHVLAAVAENDLDGEVLGISWDGTGYGSDGSIWGGEFLAVEGTRIRRAAHLLPFRLPGGEVAAREPRRSALGVLHAIGDARTADAFTASEASILRTMLDRKTNSPLTSSAGRLFDAVSSLLGLSQHASFEGEAAMAVEFAAERSTVDLDLEPLALGGDDPLVLDWRPTLASLLAARDLGASAADLAAAFHRALADAMVAVARRIEMERVVLSGGCFQNARLTELAVAGLAAAGFEVYRQRRVPPNDGGLAVGQALFAARWMAEELR